jgi:hypothetical protein
MSLSKLKPQLMLLAGFVTFLLVFVFAPTHREPFQTSGPAPAPAPAPSSKPIVSVNEYSKTVEDDEKTTGVSYMIVGLLVLIIFVLIGYILTLRADGPTQEYTISVPENGTPRVSNNGISTRMDPKLVMGLAAGSIVLAFIVYILYFSDETEKPTPAPAPAPSPAAK